MKPSEYFGCVDGDCPHDNVQECFQAAMKLADELHAEVNQLRQGCVDIINGPELTRRQYRVSLYKLLRSTDAAKPGGADAV